MNAFSFDITDNSLIVKQENTYPEWVTTSVFTTVRTSDRYL